VGDVCGQMLVLVERETATNACGSPFVGHHLKSLEDNLLEFPWS
jgi:hypothetical protein